MAVYTHSGMSRKEGLKESLQEQEAVALALHCCMLPCLGNHLGHQALVKLNQLFPNVDFLWLYSVFLQYALVYAHGSTHGRVPLPMCPCFCEPPAHPLVLSAPVVTGLWTGIHKQGRGH